MADFDPASMGEDVDPELARAIEASYRSQTGAGMQHNEEEVLAEALRISALEEEERKRRELGQAEPDVEPGANFGSSGGASGATAGAMPSDRWQTPSNLAGPIATDDISQEDLAAIAASGALDETPRSAPMDVEDPFSAFGGSALDVVAGAGAARSGSNHDVLAPTGMDADAMQAAAVAEQAEETDRQLAMAIEASYNAQTEAGQLQNEDDLMAQALRMSQQEEDARQRATLREQQELELKESILMDQMREEEQKRRRIEEEQLEQLESERLKEEAAKREQEIEAQKREEELKRSRIPPEPPSDEPGRVDFMIRLPDGKRLRRAFRGSDKLDQVYDYVDIEAKESIPGPALYRLVTTMPRQVFQDRSLTLADAGLKGQCALIAEAASG